LDEKIKTSDSRITAVFQVINVASRGDIHLEVSDSRYYEYLHDIHECDFKLFKLVLFNVKWFRPRVHERYPDRTVIEHANGFTMVNRRNVEPGSKTYVLLSQCEHVFYVEVLSNAGWSYVVRYDPRGRSVKYNIVEEDEIEKEDNVEEQRLHVSDKDLEEVQGYVN